MSVHICSDNFLPIYYKNTLPKMILKRTISVNISALVRIFLVWMSLTMVLAASFFPPLWLATRDVESQNVLYHVIELTETSIKNCFKRNVMQRRCFNRCEHFGMQGKVILFSVPKRILWQFSEFEPKPFALSNHITVSSALVHKYSVSLHLCV